MQGFGSAAAGYFDRQYAATQDVLAAISVLGLLVLFLLAALVMRELARSRR